LGLNLVSMSCGPFVLAVFLGVTSGQDPRLPVPDAAALKQAEKLVHEVLKDDYARKDPASRRALGQKLLSQAETSKDEPASHFVLLSDARDIAAETGELKVAMTACDRLAEQFQVDRVAVRRACLDRLRKPATPEEAALLTEAFFRLMDEAVSAENFEVALGASRDAEQAAQKSKQLPLLSKARARGRDVAGLRGEFQRAEGARKKLEAQPDDAESSFVLGRFLVAVKGDWESGLALLAKGSNPAWKDLATREAKTPLETSDQLALGDGWWELGSKEEGAGKSRLWTRAALCYQRGLPDASGLQRLKIEKRLEEIAQSGLMLPTGAPVVVPAGLIAWWKLDETSGKTVTDSSGLGRHGECVNNNPVRKPGRIGGALSFDGAGDYVTISSPPLTEVTNTFTLAMWALPTMDRQKSDEAVTGNSGSNQRYAIYPAHGRSFGGGHAGAGVSIGTNGVSVLEHADGYLPSVLVHNAPIKDWTHVAVVYSNKEPKLYLNGKLAKTGLKGPMTVHPSLGLGEIGRGYGYYAGLLDDVRIYDRALGDAELQKLASGK